MELYECKGHQAVLKPSCGFGWEPSFTQSRNFPLVEAKVHLIYYHQVCYPSMAGEDTPDSHSASLEVHRTPEDIIPEPSTGTMQGIPDKARRYLYTSRPQQTLARPPIIPQRQRIGNWKKEFHSMTKEQIRKTQKLVEHEEQPYGWGPVFTDSEEDEIDPEPQIPECHPPYRGESNLFGPNPQSVPEPQACFK